MNLTEYCVSKKIDPETFKKAEPTKWLEFSEIFNQVHPESFTQQKKFLINDIRRKYPLKETVQATNPTVPAAKPAIKVAPKIKKAE